jgi:hypothetical protein
MDRLEAKIKHGLEDKGIPCQSVYRIPDPDDPRVLIAFSSNGNHRLTPMKIERVLNSLGVGEFQAPKDFQRLSAAFLHLEVAMGSRTEKPAAVRAM